MHDRRILKDLNWFPRSSRINLIPFAKNHQRFTGLFHKKETGRALNRYINFWLVFKQKMIKKRQISIFTLYDLGPWVLITAGTGNGSITQCINLDDTFAYVLWNTLFYCTLRFGTFSSSCHVLLLKSFFYDVFLDILLKCRIIKMRLLLQKYDNPIMLSKSWIKLLLLKLCEEFA